MTRTSGKLDSNATLKKVGASIRARRVAAGLSQEALADAAGVDRSHMGKIERGERNVTLLLLERIAAALTVSISVIATDACI
jgi:transcriptional regulator with XRE-family HTH domain